MVKVRIRPDTKKCYFDFHYLGCRIREHSVLDGTKANVQKLKIIARKIDAEIELGTFVFVSYFPNSPSLEKVQNAQLIKTAEDNRLSRVREGLSAEIPTFTSFTEKWFEENEARWRRNTRRFYRSLLSKHLIPAFGTTVISDITREDLITLRTQLGKVKSRNGNSALSNRTVNSVMTLLKTIMDEAVSTAV